MAKLYPVKLTEPEREQLRAMTTQGNRASALSQQRARPLLLADAGRGDQTIAEALPDRPHYGRAHPATLL